MDSAYGLEMSFRVELQKWFITLSGCERIGKENVKVRFKIIFLCKIVES